MSKPPPKNLSEALKPITDEITPRNWFENQSLCLGGAGTSLAVLLVVLQLAFSASDTAKEDLVVSITFSGIALILWIALWQMSDTYAFWKEESLEHSLQPKWLICGVLLFSTAIGSLAAALIVLVQIISTVAAALIGFTGIFVLAFVLWHVSLVQRLVLAKKSARRNKA